MKQLDLILFKCRYDHVTLLLTTYVSPMCRLVPEHKESFQQICVTQMNKKRTKCNLNVLTKNETQNKMEMSRCQKQRNPKLGLEEGTELTVTFRCQDRL